MNLIFYANFVRQIKARRARAHELNINNRVEDEVPFRASPLHIILPRYGYSNNFKRGGGEGVAKFSRCKVVFGYI